MLILRLLVVLDILFLFVIDVILIFDMDMVVLLFEEEIVIFLLIIYLVLVEKFCGMEVDCLIIFVEVIVGVNVNMVGNSFLSILVVLFSLMCILFMYIFI